MAKGTLKDSGISLHTFASCPDSLIRHKSIYFNLLQQLRKLSYKVELSSDYLDGKSGAATIQPQILSYGNHLIYALRPNIVRLARLLFPLSTQLRVSTKSPVVTSASCGFHDAVTALPPVTSAPRNSIPASALSSKQSFISQGKILRLTHSDKPSSIPPDTMLRS